jgi:hypothetical protein
MCLDVRGIQCGAVPVDVTSGVGFRLQRLKDALPRAIAPPAYETVVAGLVGPVPGLGRRASRRRYEASRGCR